MADPRLVLVEWDDAAFEVGWAKELEELQLAYNQSVGYLLVRDKKKIVIASSWSKTAGDDIHSFGDYTIIPRRDIRKLVYLKPPRTKRGVVR